MFELVTIYHNSPNSFPRFFQLDFKFLRFKLHFPATDESLLHLLPDIYSSAASPISSSFSCEPLPHSDCFILFSDYLIGLQQYLDEFIKLIGLQASSELDFVRIHFQTGEFNRARNIVKKMDQTAETRMLMFYMKNKPNEWQFNEYVSLTNITDLIIKNKTTKWMKMMKITKKLDENTKIVFILQMIGIIPYTKYLITLIKLNITDKYKSVYLKIKLAEYLEKNKQVIPKIHLAGSLLLLSAIELNCGQDLKLRDDLLYRGMEQIKNESWRRIIWKKIETLLYNQMKDVGMYTCSSLFMFSLQNNQQQDDSTDKIKIKAMPYRNVYKIKPVRRILKNHFTDAIYIEINQESKPELVKFDDGTVQQLISHNKGYLCYPEEKYNSEIIINEILFRDGFSYKMGQTFTKIEKKYVLAYTKTESEEGLARIIYKCVPAVNNQHPKVSSVLTWKWSSSNLIIEINLKNIKNSTSNKDTCLVEINDGIYEDYYDDIINKLKV